MLGIIRVGGLGSTCMGWLCTVILIALDWAWLQKADHVLHYVGWGGIDPARLGSAKLVSVGLGLVSLG